MTDTPKPKTGEPCNRCHHEKDDHFTVQHQRGLVRSGCKRRLCKCPRFEPTPPVGETGPPAWLCPDRLATGRCDHPHESDFQRGVEAGARDMRERAAALADKELRRMTLRIRKAIADGGEPVDWPGVWVIVREGILRLPLSPDAPAQEKE